MNFIELIIFFSVIGYLKKNAKRLQTPPAAPSPFAPATEAAT